MKKKTIFKTASIVALSAIMCGTALSVTACGDNSEYELSVFIFCSTTDQATNKKICDDWAEEYTLKLREEGVIDEDTTITVDFDSRSDTGSYFDQLDNRFTAGTADDIFYLSPKYVQVWSQTGRVLDLSKYLTEDTAESLEGIWSNSLSLYGYSTDSSYTLGDSISYNSTTGNFETEDGTSVGLYGLPKDYSNFAMAYNANYYTDQMKDWLQTYGPATTRSVNGAGTSTDYKTYSNVYTGSGNSGVVTYAVSGTYTWTDSEGATNTVNAVEGADAPFIAIGVPLRYKPYNFYRYEDYNSALLQGDPIALATNTWAPNGYVITFTGFPGDTFDIASDVDVDENAYYDTDTGYWVPTYAEFGALTWATTCFCNTFNWWDASQGDGSESTLLSGTAGMTNEAGNRVNVYGCGQYEGSLLYMLPWLFSNDSDYISYDSTSAVNPGVSTSTSSLTDISSMLDLVSGQTTETRQKLRLNGEYEDVAVAYGVNSANFIETYGAFLEFGSTWNGNGENAGDAESKSDNSWANFRAGNNIFYGSGTWDAQARNDSDLSKYCTYRTMPSPVAEKYSLYSEVKDAYYCVSTYSYADGGLVSMYDNVNNKYYTQLTVDNKTTDASSACKIYTQSEIEENLTVRQDKWGARMDSVGYAVNAALEDDADNEWKLEAAVSLVAQLCVNEDAQATLCYGGAQLPNFVDQCIDFLNYNVSSYKNVAGDTVSNTDGTFVHMLTPEGFYDTDPTADSDNDGILDSQEIWDYYYSVVQDLNTAASAQSTTTVAEFLKDYTDWDGTGSIRYDEQYADVQLKDFTSDLSYRAFAMKVLYMQTYVRADRDLNMRMQYGLNAARDSATYTYDSDWYEALSTRDGSSLAYMNQAPVTDIAALVRTSFSQSAASTTYMTAAVYCLLTAGTIQEYLNLDIQRMKADLNS